MSIHLKQKQALAFLINATWPCCTTLRAHKHLCVFCTQYYLSRNKCYKTYCFCYQEDKPTKHAQNRLLLWDLTCHRQPYVNCMVRAIDVYFCIPVYTEIFWSLWSLRVGYFPVCLNALGCCL